MASKWSNRNLPGALHFVTGNVSNRLPIFKDSAYCRVLIEEIQELRSKRACKLIAFVVMPDHLHVVLNPRDGDIQECTGALKSISAKRLVEASPKNLFLRQDGLNHVWQESFKALPLWSNWMIMQKVTYIHNNPLKAGLTHSAKDYKWSSFRAYYLEESNDLLQIDKEWWWEDDVRKLSESMAAWDRELKEKNNSTKETKVKMDHNKH